jgi:toxin ParE1/3/4
MTLRLRFHDEALTEIRNAAGWYDRQRRGLGDEFLDALYARLEDLISDPSSVVGRIQGAPPELPVRRILLRRFPYAVVFVEADDEIRVIAVMHGKRKPEYWLRRWTK